jgi:Ca2+-binding EF-hand superfamily protein
METDVVPFSAIQRGIQVTHSQALLRSEAEAARKNEEEERRQQDLDSKRMLEEYTVLYAEMQGQEQIKAILEEGKVLTGDDVRPGDAGYEFEVPPSGPHVTMLSKLLTLLGFDSLDKSKEKPRTPSSAVVPEAAPLLSSADDKQVSATAGEKWWDDELAGAWTTLQEMSSVEIADGVVEQEMLESVLVPPVGYPAQRTKIVEELEKRQDQDDVIEKDRSSRRNSFAGVVDAVLDKRKKPSIDSLCELLGITMSRMVWLHRLFESFLQPDEKNPGVVPVCLYPETPAAITKVQMRALMKELRPSMEEVEFEARFRRIDQDLSGMVEFDEFVMWVREDEVRVGGAAPLQKMSFEELAIVYSESVELIKYLHDQFQEVFPAGEIDDYPANPRSLGKSEVRDLMSSLAPELNDAQFETEFQMVTFSKKDNLEFDEFLELLPMDELPDEIRDRGDASRPISPKI